MRTRLVIRFAVVSALIISGASAPALAQTAARPGTPPTPAPRTPTQPSPGPVRDPGGRPATTPLPPGKGVLAGSVTTTAGQPAAGARVMLNGGDGPSRTTTTDARGQFVFEGLRTGRYNVTVMKPGYITFAYGQRRAMSGGTPIPLTDGERRDIQIQIPRGSVITGTVLDERGEPSINTNVRAMRYSFMSGRRRAQQVGGGQTDDRGIYRIHSLTPGEYAVCAVARNFGPMNDAQRIEMEIESLRRSIENTSNSAAMRQSMNERLAQLQAQRVEPTEPALGYAPVCFPTPTLSGSSTITVAAGEERSGIDIQMIMTPVARVEGLIVAPGGNPVRNVQVMMMNADESLSDVDRPGTGVEPSGRFVFQNIAPGRYTINARTMQMGPPGPPGTGPVQTQERLWAQAEVNVAGQDVSGVVLELRGGVTLSGSIAFQPTTLPQPDVSRVQVSVFPSSPENNMMMMGPSPQAKIDSNGRFTMTDVFPGKYRVSAAVIGVQGWVVDSIMAGNQDALDFPLEVSGSRNVSGIVVTFGDRVTELSGTIATQQGEPATEQTILLYPADQKYWTPQSRRIRTVRASADGQFNFRIVPPGEYRLTTLVDPDPGIWYDREVLEQLDSSSVRIVLAEGEKKVEHVRIR